MTRFPKILALAAALLCAAPLAAAAAAPQNDAQVYIIHGIPGQDIGGDPALPVDITVDGACALENVPFGAIAGPLPFAPGRYKIEIRPADLVNPCSQPPIITADVDFFADESATVIAHLLEDGSASATKFTNDLSATETLQSRLIVQHAAAAPAVDVKLKRLNGLGFGKVRFVPNAPNGAQAGIDLFAGVWAISFAPAGTTPTVFSQFLILRPGTVYLAYAVGTVGTDSFQLIILPLPAEG